MSSLFVRVIYIIISLSVAKAILHLMRKKGRVKHGMLAFVGLFIVVDTIIHFIVCFAQGCSYDRNLLILIIFFVVGVLIFSVWGVSKKSLTTKQN